MACDSLDNMHICKGPNAILIAGMGEGVGGGGGGVERVWGKYGLGAEGKERQNEKVSLKWNTCKCSKEKWIIT